MTTSEIEIAWAAGFWDGEGSVYAGKSALPHLSLTQCGDEGRELCERFARALGVSVDRERCRPYLSRTKIRQAEAILLAHSERKRAYVHHFGRRTHCANGHEFTVENTSLRKGTGTRLCRTCARGRDAATVRSGSGVAS